MRARKSKILLVAGTVALLSVVVIYFFGTEIKALGRMVIGHPQVLYTVDTDRPAVALTIDDGPDGETTPRILDTLARHHATATFFVIADRIRGNEALMRRIVSEGHEIGNHMTRDEPSIKLPTAEFEAELLSAHRTLSAYVAPRWFRPGSGWFNEPMLTVLKKHGYRCALGTVYPLDAHHSSSWLAQKLILAMARPGRIIILHDGGRRGKRTIRTLEAVLPGLQQRGFRIRTLSGIKKTANR